MKDNFIEKKELIEMLKSGLTPEDIANIFSIEHRDILMMIKEIGQIKTLKKTKNIQNKVTYKEKCEILRLINDGYSYFDIIRLYGINADVLLDILESEFMLI